VAAVRYGSWSSVELPVIAADQADLASADNIRAGSVIMAYVGRPGSVHDVRGRLGLVAFTVPEAVERLLTINVAGEIARAFGDQPVYPQRVVVDYPAEPSTRGLVPGGGSRAGQDRSWCCRMRTRGSDRGAYQPMGR
jgi:hypothetical protein